MISMMKGRFEVEPVLRDCRNRGWSPAQCDMDAARQNLECWRCVWERIFSTLESLCPWARGFPPNMRAATVTEYRHGFGGKIAAGFAQGLCSSTGDTDPLWFAWPI
jgi:hypothetical protein